MLHFLFCLSLFRYSIILILMSSYINVINQCNPPAFQYSKTVIKKQWSAAYNEKIFSLITTVINHCILIFIIYLITSHLLSVNNIYHLLITNNIKTGILSFFIIILFNPDKSLSFLLTTGITAVTALACTFFAKASYRK